MNVFLITGVIRCGHKLFNVEKRITASSAVNAIMVFKEDYPNAKMIRSKILRIISKKS